MANNKNSKMKKLLLQASGKEKKKGMGIRYHVSVSGPSDLGKSSKKQKSGDIEVLIRFTIPREEIEREYQSRLRQLEGKAS